MTQAVCFQCGEFKIGVYTPCHDCHAVPRTKDDLVLSLAMTEHYFDLPTLEDMAATIKSGETITLAEESRRALLEYIEEDLWMLIPPDEAEETPEVDKNFGNNSGDEHQID
jgi:hypothetical protein